MQPRRSPALRIVTKAPPRREASCPSSDRDGGPPGDAKLGVDDVQAVVAVRHPERQRERDAAMDAAGKPLAAGNVRRTFKKITTSAGLGEDWTPRELRTSFVSLMSDSGVPVEEIARLAGHSSSRTTEVIYRKELRPVITTERRLQTVDVEARDMVDDHRIQTRGGRRVVIVGEIGAGDEKRLLPSDRRGERVAKRPRGLGGLKSHDQRNDLRFRGEALEKRQLHLERVLASVRRRMLTDDRRRAHQRGRALFVDRRDAQRRLEPAGRMNGNTVEPYEM